jgi:hypothetical protein
MNVVQLHLIEEREFASFGVTEDCSTHLPDAETVTVGPFTGHTRVAARVFDCLLVLSVKKAAPIYIETF